MTRGLAAAALLGTLVGCAEPPRPTVLLVVLDTVRADHVGALGGRPDVTPHLDRLAREGVLYTHAYAQAPWTLPSHATLFTGLSPEDHGCDHASLRYDGRAPLVAERFQGAGWATGGFSNNPWIGPSTGLAAGFDVFEEPFREAYAVKYAINRWVDPAATGLPDAGAAKAVQLVDGWLAGLGDRPAFAFVNLVEAHMPYDPPEGWRGRYHAVSSVDADRNTFLRFFESSFRGAIAPADLALAEALYDEEIAYVDHQLGQLLAALQRHGRLDDALVVVTSDHGEAFGEHEVDGVRLVDHQLGLYDELLHVPLVVRWPGHVAPARQDAPVGHLDVAPLLTWRLGDGAGPLPALLAPPPDRALAASYAPQAGHKEVLESYLADPARIGRLMARSWRATRKGGLKLLAPSDAAPLLFDVAADPGETRDLAPQRAADVGALTPHLPPPPASAGGFTPSPETVEALRALGYLAPEGGPPSSPAAP